MKEATITQYANGIVLRDHNRRCAICETENNKVMIKFQSILPDQPKDNGLHGNVFCRGHYRESVSVYSIEGAAALTAALCAYFENINDKLTEQ